MRLPSPKSLGTSDPAHGGNHHRTGRLHFGTAPDPNWYRPFESDEDSAFARSWARSSGCRYDHFTFHDKELNWGAKSAWSPFSTHCDY